MLIMVETRSKHCILSHSNRYNHDVEIYVLQSFMGKRKCTCRNNFYLLTFFQ